MPFQTEKQVACEQKYEQQVADDRESIGSHGTHIDKDPCFFNNGNENTVQYRSYHHECDDPCKVVW
ncbi:hypothetical protein BCR33DRAFT_722000 [Rhizoclosmatium globosum]|uniref:Uncharacterized protein n=1 Tax=Rhizoclosmatium globosum TaxID=329046 RepID=A0A1Y2BQP7_9FUNG|nr:hypothetical protein BCR33DRAFT_722000 [Rhizoclosmatium globosum]|eukprot:ORY36475.1 hypothetical protein BCR33DRAFT_722000 [Rhizoclosmatium globosum]